LLSTPRKTSTETDFSHQNFEISIIDDARSVYRPIFQHFPTISGIGHYLVYSV
jgi:hypothetical protein